MKWDEALNAEVLSNYDVKPSICEKEESFMLTNDAVSTNGVIKMNMRASGYSR